jgi:hypothetical protein
MIRKKVLSFLLSALLIATLLPTTTFQADAASTSLGTAKILSLYYYADEAVAVCQVSQGPDDVSYEFQASLSSSFEETTTKSKIVSYQSDGYEISLSSLPSGMTGYVRVRYTKTVDGTTITGDWSNIISKTMASSSGITASNITKDSSSKEQSFSVGATASSASSLKYISDNDSIQVNSNGKITVAAGYVGSAQITITIVDSNGEETTSKRITVTIQKAATTTEKPAETTTAAPSEVTTTKPAATTTAAPSEVTTEKPAATTPVKLATPSLKSASNTAAGISIKWSAVENADGYRLYRKNSAGKWTLVQTIEDGSSTSAVDSNVKNGTKYTYTVRAYCKNNGKTVLSSYNKTGKTTYRLTSPVHNGLKNSASKKVTVKWKKNSSATGYQIQYSYSNSFSSKKQITVKKASTTSTTISKLTKNKKCYVRTRAYKTVNGVTYYSSWNSIHYITVRK